MPIERFPIDDVRGLFPPLFGDEFLLCSDAVAAANIACCCFKAWSVEANKLEATMDGSLSVEVFRFGARWAMAVPPLHSFAAAKSEAKLGVLETVPVEEEEGGSVWRFR